MVCSHWLTLSTCTGDVIADRRSFVSRGHLSTTQLYTSGWTCTKWTGGRATSGGGTGGHTQEGSRNTPLALLTGHFHFNTHTLLVSGAETTSLTGIPLPLLSLATPPLPLLLSLFPLHLTILSQLVRELLILSEPT